MLKLITNIKSRQILESYLHQGLKMIVQMYLNRYRDTIAGSPPGERIIFFEKIRYASQKLNFSNFFLAKKSIKMTLNSPEVKTMLQKIIYSYFIFMSS